MASTLKETLCLRQRFSCFITPNFVFLADLFWHAFAGR